MVVANRIPREVIDLKTNFLKDVPFILICPLCLYYFLVMPSIVKITCNNLSS